MSSGIFTDVNYELRRRNYFLSFSTNLRSRNSDSHLKTCVHAITATVNSKQPTLNPVELWFLSLIAAIIITRAQTEITTASQKMMLRRRDMVLISSGRRASSIAAEMNASSALSNDFINEIAAVIARMHNGGNPFSNWKFYFNFASVALTASKFGKSFGVGVCSLYWMTPALSMTNAARADVSPTPASIGNTTS